MNPTAKKTVSIETCFPMMQTLEDRRLLAADPVNGVLTVTGTERKDQIDISYYLNNPDKILVRVNRSRAVYDRADVTSIQVEGKGGNDHIRVHNKSTFNIPVSVSGGAGDDKIWGGAGDDTLNGGAGKDYLWGYGGDDHLDGGVNDDSLEGGSGDDRCRGGKGRDRVLSGAGKDVFHADDDRRERRDQSKDDLLRRGRGWDDGPNHDVGDDHGSGGHGTDDGPAHDANDDHGDDGPGHT